MSIEIKERIFDSGKPGPIFLVTGAVHGTEVCGPNGITEVIRMLEGSQSNLKITSGALIAVPVVNQAARDANKRQISEFDLNRVCERHPDNGHLTNEEQVANATVDLFDRVLARAGRQKKYHVDCHSHGTPNSSPFAFLETENPEGLRFCENLPIAYACIGWKKLYDGRKQPSVTDYLVNRGAIVVTVECGHHDDKGVAEIARDSILCGMSDAGMINQTYSVKREGPLGVLEVTDIIPRDAGVDRLARWRHLDEVASGTLVWHGKDGRPFITDKSFVAFFPTQKIEVEKPDPEDVYTSEWKQRPVKIDRPQVVHRPRAG